MSSKDSPDGLAVELKPGAAGGKSAGGHYWHIYSGGVRAGRVFIEPANQPPFGPHYSIQIHINQACRGRGIGSVAYRLACETSGCSEIYAHMRKSNIASRRAAEKAGFGVVARPGIRQLSLVWRRPASDRSR